MIQHRHYICAAKAKAQQASDLLETTFEDIGIPVSLYEEDAEQHLWGVSIYVPEEQSFKTKETMEHALNIAGIMQPVETQIIPETDWVAQTLRELKPIRAGIFLLHGSHDKHIARPSDIAINIDAGLAFGTGHHATTTGCLEMIADQLKARQFYNPLDLGTGSGLLAIALAKKARTHILATDIDPVATLVATQNARINAVAPWVDCVTATGFNHNAIRKRAPFDLVVANILAGPLRKMASEFSNHLAPGATVVLSGLLTHQKASILAAYKIHGMRYIKSYVEKDWLTLVLRAQ